MKRIMHVIPGDLWAGKESQTYYVLKALKSKGTFDISIVLFNEGELFTRLEQLGMNPIVIDENNQNAWRVFRMLMKAIQTIDPDIIHTHEYKAHIFAGLSKVLMRTRYKIVRTLHGINTAPPGLRNVKAHVLLGLDDIMMHWMTDCIIAVSGSIRQRLVKRYPHIRISQVNNSIEIPLYNDITRSSIRSRFRIPQDALWICTAARLVPVKNIEMLVETARVLSGKQGVRFTVSIFGDGPMWKELGDMIKCYGLDEKVLLHGHQPDLLSIMGASDIFVLTSWSEGMPMSLLEAMSLGLIPVCTKVGGIQEVIAEGFNGFMVDVNDNGALAEVLYQVFLMEDGQRKEMGIRARETIMREYSMDTYIARIQTLYEEVMGKA